MLSDNNESRYGSGWLCAKARRSNWTARGSRDIGKQSEIVKLFSVNIATGEAAPAGAEHGSGGRFLLLFPGLLCDARLWRDQVAALCPGVCCVVADCTADDTLDGMARRALSAALGRFAVAGLSMGGYAALALMRLAPQRVLGLCLMDTSARPDTPEQARRRRGLMGLAARGGRFKGVTPRLMPQLLHPDRLSDQALCQEVMAMADRVGPAAFLRQQGAILARPDSRPNLAAVAVPTLVAVGAGDQLTPPSLSAEMAALIPGAVLREVAGAGHLLPMERPEETTALLRNWLDATFPVQQRPEA